MLAQLKEILIAFLWGMLARAELIERLFWFKMDNFKELQKIIYEKEKINYSLKRLNSIDFIYRDHGLIGISENNNNRFNLLTIQKIIFT